MSKEDWRNAVETVACEICRKELPKDEAKNPEAIDYVVFLCGRECYEKWLQEAKAAGYISDDGAS